MGENQQKKKEKQRPGRKKGVKVKHGAFSLIARGTLPQKRRYLERFLTELREGLIRDLGPEEENLTTAQRILVDRVVGKVGILRCLEEHVRETGVFEEQELAPCLRKSYISYSNSLRLDLQALGIDAKLDDRILSPAELIRQIEEEEK